MFVEPSDIPGTGRFAVVSDPQGAVFGILQPLPMDDESAGGGAFDQESDGHGSARAHEPRHETAALSSSYAAQFGWTKGDTVSTWATSATWASTRSSGTAAATSVASWDSATRQFRRG